MYRTFRNILADTRDSALSDVVTGAPPSAPSAAGTVEGMDASASARSSSVWGKGLRRGRLGPFATWFSMRSTTSSPIGYSHWLLLRPPPRAASAQKQFPPSPLTLASPPDAVHAPPPQTYPDCRDTQRCLASAAGAHDNGGTRGHR